MNLIFNINLNVNELDYQVLQNNLGKNCTIGNEFNYFYDIYCNSTFITKINKSRLNNFLHYIENSNENIYNYSIILERKMYHRNITMNIKIYADFNKVYEKLINNNLSNYEIDYFCYHFIWKNKKLKDNEWKLHSFPNKIKITKQPKNLDVKLFKYQLQTLNLMKEIENEKESNKIINENCFYDIFEEDRFKDINFDIFKKTITKDSLNFKISGGILADEMGLGKTLTSISLILDKPYIYKPNRDENNFKYEMRDDKLMCKATIIFCPSHLTKQWSGEIKKANKNIKQILILTQTNHKKYSIKDVLEYDVIIVSFQFLCNPMYYLNIVKNTSYNWTLRNLEEEGSCSKRFNIIDRSFKFNKDQIINNNLIIEKIHWYRVIIDEAHELFRSCYLENNYLQHFLKNIKSDNKWYISGTPFHNMYTLKNVLNFLDFKVKIDDKYYCNINECLEKGLSENNVMKTIKDKIYIRNTKESVKNQISIPKANIENIILEFSDFEKKLYLSLSKYKTDSYLRMLCCNIQISDQFFSDNNTILNFDEVKQKLIIHNKKKIQKTEISLSNLVPSIPNYNALKQRLENIIVSCKYLISSFENNCKISDENCPICHCEFEDPIITDCGHHFCYECINQVLDYNKKECPICRQNIDKSKIFKLDNIDKDNKIVDALVYQYGTKLAKLIKLCNQILLNPDNKIIIFSEYDRLLSMIGNILKLNNINNVFCKGNVHQRNMAISTFRKDSKNKKKDTKVIMLSTEHAASGTNLTEANHIIFMESHEGEYGDIKAMEDQAIGRAVRLGQENQVNVIRLIIKDTIEENLFNNYINQN